MATPPRTAKHLAREVETCLEAEHETDGAPVETDVAGRQSLRSAAATAATLHRRRSRKRWPLQAADERHSPTQDTCPYTLESIPRPRRRKGRQLRPAARACHADWSSSRLDLRACRRDEHPGRTTRMGRACGRCAWTLCRRGRRLRPSTERAAPRGEKRGQHGALLRARPPCRRTCRPCSTACTRRSAGPRTASTASIPTGSSASRCERQIDRM